MRKYRSGNPGDYFGSVGVEMLNKKYKNVVRVGVRIFNYNVLFTKKN